MHMSLHTCLIGKWALPTDGWLTKCVWEQLLLAEDNKGLADPPASTSPADLPGNSVKVSPQHSLYTLSPFSHLIVMSSLFGFVISKFQVLGGVVPHNSIRLEG